MGESAQLMFWVGIMLVVSAGSFIYVATIHILPEVMNDSHSHHGHEVKKNPSEKRSYGKGIEMLAMILGLIAPLGLTFLEDE